MNDPTEKHVIIYDEVKVARFKLEDLFKEFFIQLQTASSETELFYLITETNLKYDLIIFNDSFENNRGFEILSRLRELHAGIPILFLTTNDNRETILKVISAGVSDYLLKPFTETIVLERVLKIVNSNRPNIRTIIPPVSHEKSSEIINYLRGELKKSKKGNYEVSLLMFKLFIPASKDTENDPEYHSYVSDCFQEKLIDILWDTDTIKRNDSNSFLGVFPFCGINNIRKVYSKIIDCFDDLKKSNNKLSDFRLVLSSVTYPSKDDSAEELLKYLETSTEKEIKDINGIILKFK